MTLPPNPNDFQTEFTSDEELEKFRRRNTGPIDPRQGTTPANAVTPAASGAVSKGLDELEAKPTTGRDMFISHRVARSSSNMIRDRVEKMTPEQNAEQVRRAQQAWDNLDARQKAVYEQKFKESNEGKPLSFLEQGRADNAERMANRGPSDIADRQAAQKQGMSDKLAAGSPGIDRAREAVRAEDAGRVESQRMKDPGELSTMLTEQTGAPASVTTGAPAGTVGQVSTDGGKSFSPMGDGGYRPLADIMSGKVPDYPENVAAVNEAEDWWDMKNSGKSPAGQASVEPARRGVPTAGAPTTGQPTQRTAQVNQTMAKPLKETLGA